jgi:hypothetical protein
MRAAVDFPRESGSRGPIVMSVVVGSKMARMGRQRQSNGLRNGEVTDYAACVSSDTRIAKEQKRTDQTIAALACLIGLRNIPTSTSPSASKTGAKQTYSPHN